MTRPSFADRWFTDGLVVWSSTSGPAVCQMRPLDPSGKEGTLTPIADEEERKRCARMIAAAPALLKAAKEILAKLDFGLDEDVELLLESEEGLLREAVDLAEGRRT